MTKLAVGFLFVATAAMAQGKPTLVDFPLDVKSAMGDAQLTELQDDFRQLLAKNNGVLVPTRTNWKLAVAAHKRQDCEVRNECLQQLAISAGTLYALYCSVEKNASGDVTATGRVVNQDGVLVRPPEQVKLARGGSFGETAREALKQLLAKLSLEKLSPVLEKKVEEVKDPIILVQSPQQAPPPSSSLRAAGFVTGGLAVVGVGVAIGFGVSASAARGQLPADGHFTNENQARSQASVNTGATIALIGGAAAVVLAATSVAMFVLSVPSTDASIAIAPGPNGAAVVLNGRF